MRLIRIGLVLTMAGAVMALAASSSVSARQNPAPQVTSAGRVIVVLIDDLNLPPAQSAPLQGLLMTLRDEILRSDDRVALVSTGVSSIASDLALDARRVRFDAAVAKLDAASGAVAQAQTATGDAAAGRRAYVAYATARDVLNRIGLLPAGEKYFVWLTTSAVSGSVVSGATAVAPGLSTEIADLQRLVQEHRVVLNAVDPADARAADALRRLR